MHGMHLMTRRSVLVTAAVLGLAGIAGFAQYTGRFDYGVRVLDDEVVLFPFDQYSIRFGPACSSISSRPGG